jgi:hypothetical protein
MGGLQLLDLPNELLHIVSQFLSTEELVSLESCCSGLRRRLMCDRWKYIHFSLDLTTERRCIHGTEPFVPLSQLHSHQSKFVHFCGDPWPGLRHIVSTSGVQETVRGVCINGGSPQDVKKLLVELHGALPELELIDLAGVAMDPKVVDLLNQLYPETAVLLEIAEVSHNELIQDVPVRHRKIFGLSIDFDESTRHLFHSLRRESFMSHLRELCLTAEEPFQISSLQTFLQSCSTLHTLTLSGLGHNPRGVRWLPESVRELHVMTRYTGPSHPQPPSTNGRSVRHLTVWANMAQCLHQFQFNSLTHLTVIVSSIPDRNLDLVLSQSQRLKWLKLIDPSADGIEYLNVDVPDVFSLFRSHTSDLESLVLATRVDMTTTAETISHRQMTFPNLKLLVIDGPVKVSNNHKDLFQQFYLFATRCPKLKAIYISYVNMVYDLPPYMKVVPPSRMRPKENKILAANYIICIVDLTYFRTL